jgi:hypothetical protein
MSYVACYAADVTVPKRWICPQETCPGFLSSHDGEGVSCVRLVILARVARSDAGTELP